MTEDERPTTDDCRTQPPFPSPPPASQRSFRERVRLASLQGAGGWYGRRRAVATAPRRILLIRPDHLGDMLFATPAFRLLRQALPEAHITLLAGPWSQAVVAGNPDLDAVRTCVFPGFERQPKGGWYAPYRLLFETTAQLRGQFDAALVLRFDHWWGAWLAAAAGVPRRIGYATPETRPFLTEALPYRPNRHEAEQNATLVAALAPGAGDRPGPLRFEIGAEAQAWAAGWLAARDAADRPVIAIHPGAGAAVKQWPTAAWAEVAGRLAEQFGARILLTGSAAEQALTGAIAAELTEPPLDAAGQTDLRQLAALFARCALVLGADSGPLHLAVAAGTATVHLYGPVSAAKFGPWGDPARHVVLRTSWPCAPCNRLDWPAAALARHACMAVITPDEVTKRAEDLLQGAGILPNH